MIIERGPNTIIIRRQLGDRPRVRVGVLGYQCIRFIYSDRTQRSLSPIVAQTRYGLCKPHEEWTIADCQALLEAMEKHEGLPF